ncbi:hypothetical protein [Mycoplasma nasistruthionis]|uniref:Lipoprotein n=1 Tax=Mycoplasma nasistruthionis TaxID=353852 RepID=A0A5B7XV80_9MOLU|nr:hypothetical protein [Mycoplasma nasistruthionis]QCZ36726.1 hypothetical protein FG904_01735 [Mycoplasma nasistruthionis]
MRKNIKLWLPLLSTSVLPVALSAACVQTETQETNTVSKDLKVLTTTEVKVRDLEQKIEKAKSEIQKILNSDAEVKAKVEELTNQLDNEKQTEIEATKTKVAEFQETIKQLTSDKENLFNELRTAQVSDSSELDDLLADKTRIESELFSYSDTVLTRTGKLKAIESKITEIERQKTELNSLVNKIVEDISEANSKKSQYGEDLVRITNHQENVNLTRKQLEDVIANLKTQKAFFDQKQNAITELENTFNDKRQALEAEKTEANALLQKAKNLKTDLFLIDHYMKQIIRAQSEVSNNVNEGLKTLSAFATVEVELGIKIKSSLVPIYSLTLPQSIAKINELKTQVNDYIDSVVVDEKYSSNEDFVTKVKEFKQTFQTQMDELIKKINDAKEYFESLKEKHNTDQFTNDNVTIINLESLVPKWMNDCLTQIGENTKIVDEATNKVLEFDKFKQFEVTLKSDYQNILSSISTQAEAVNLDFNRPEVIDNSLTHYVKSQNETRLNNQINALNAFVSAGNSLKTKLLAQIEKLNQAKTEAEQEKTKALKNIATPKEEEVTRINALESLKAKITKAREKLAESSEYDKVQSKIAEIDKKLKRANYDLKVSQQEVITVENKYLNIERNRKNTYNTLAVNKIKIAELGKEIQKMQKELENFKDPEEKPYEIDKHLKYSKITEE